MPKNHLLKAVVVEECSVQVGMSLPDMLPHPHPHRRLLTRKGIVPKRKELRPKLR